MVKSLTGVLVRVSGNEEQPFSQVESSLSITYSSQVGARGLLLGHARFIYHSYKPNFQLTTGGKEQLN